MNDGYITVVLSNNMKITSRPENVIIFDSANELGKQAMSDIQNDKIIINAKQIVMIKKPDDVEMKHYDCMGY